MTNRLAWAERLEQTEPRRVVTCGSCHRSVPWHEFARRHLWKCQDEGGTLEVET